MPFRTNLLDLPHEIFKPILAEAVNVRGVQRSLRLRLVNRLFSDELIEALCVSGLTSRISMEVSKWPHAVLFAEKCLVERRTNAFPKLKRIRSIAEELAARDKHSQKYKGYALNLLRLAATTGCSTVNMVFRSPRLWRLRAENSFHDDLLTAAIYTNHVSLEECLSETHLELRGGMFGNPHLAAIRTRNYHVLDVLLARGRSRSSKMDVLIMATYHGDIQMVSYILESCPDLFQKYIRSGIQDYSTNTAMCNLLQTPSTEVFNLILTKIEAFERRNRCILTPKTMKIPFSTAIEKGWTDMARHLMLLGTRIHEPVTTLSYACRFEHMEIVEMLVKEGASVNEGALTVAAGGESSILKKLRDVGADVDDWEARDCLYAAARKGHIVNVRMLLGAGVDPNRGEVKPLVGAVESEHTAMFRILVEGGADITRALPEARKRAKAAGLESMLVLLREYEVLKQ